MMTAKEDFKITLDVYQAKVGEFRDLNVPPLQYLMIDGHGDPNTSSEFTQAVQSLYPLAYKLKFASKNELGHDYVVMPLEGLWWAEDMKSFTCSRDKAKWNWTLLMMTPEWITPDMFADAVRAVSSKKGPPRLHDIRLETLTEGRCVQTLHIGPYDAEADIIQEMHRESVHGRGLQLTGKHHEIYLSDARRVAPEKLRTILRQPVSTARSD